MHANVTNNVFQFKFMNRKKILKYRVNVSVEEGKIYLLSQHEKKPFAARLICCWLNEWLNKRNAA